MQGAYAEIVQEDGGWWIGWVEEVSGVNAQEKTKASLLISLRQILAEAIEFENKGHKSR